jgi:multiple sugar transport system ATP-binding protein
LQREGSRMTFVETNSAGAPWGLEVSGALGAVAMGKTGQPVILGVRPEDVHEVAPGQTTVTATVEVVEPLGAETLLHLSTGATNFIARVRPTTTLTRGAKACFAFDLDKAHLFNPATEQRLA